MRYEILISPWFCASKLLLESFGLMKSVDLLPEIKLSDGTVVKSVVCGRSISEITVFSFLRFCTLLGFLLSRWIDSTCEFVFLKSDCHPQIVCSFLFFETKLTIYSNFWRCTRKPTGSILPMEFCGVLCFYSLMIFGLPVLYVWHLFYN